MKFKTKKLKKQESLAVVKRRELEEISHDLEIVDIDSVKPWELNPKKYQKKIDEIANSLKQHGQRTPVSVWDKDRKIYKGCNTWFAMKKLGYKRIAVIWQDFEDDKQAQSYALIDNVTGADPEWDDGLLASLLQGETFEGIKSGELAILTGFKEKDLKGLLLSTSELPDILPDVDLSGNVSDKADFFVIQFENKEEMHKFKERLGFKTKHPRVVPYKDLMTVMKWIVPEKLPIQNRSLKKKLIFKRK